MGSHDSSPSTLSRSTLARHTPGANSWSLTAAGLVLTLLYSVHLFYCQHSALPFIDDAFINSDMHANLVWASGIREQGWLNPLPHHPWNNWMQNIAPYSEWVVWWGGENIFQQSPLYAYLLSLFLHRLFFMRVLQALMSMGTCVFIGLLTARISGRTAGWIAYWLAALYAPFYAYSWPFLRDGLGWFITAAVLWVLSDLTQTAWPSGRARLFGWSAGVLLGLGFLAKESFLLLIPAVWAGLAVFAWRRAHWGVVTRVAIATVLTISPLIVRNWLVNAPLLSSSNRLVETFIEGNAGTSQPERFFIPIEIGRILYETHAQLLPVFRATVASHPDGVPGWMRLQRLKLFCLLDPYESPDNLSIYFMAYVSPVVRLGLRYWMILAPALLGLGLSIRRRECRHLWLGVFLPITLATVLVGVPLSRYRQSLMLLFIPWAAYFFTFLGVLIRRREFHKAAYSGVALLAGCWLIQPPRASLSVLDPLSWQPPGEYERPVEYMLSAEIYHRLGEEQKAQAMISLVRRKFPGVLP
jgi:4-amino-4-deoxy-L-arabinose transferase-like glycosyltransferase